MALFINQKTGAMSSTQGQDFVPFTGGALPDYQKTDTPVVPVVPTPSNAYADINFETPEEKAFREKTALENKTNANTAIDETAIRSNTLSKFQAEIDALNKVYAEKKQLEQIAGAGRMGGVAAVGARRGLIGSDFGIAQENNQTQANTEAVNSIENERLSKYNAIMSDARSYADTEIAKKEAARKLSSEDYLKYIASQQATRKSTTSEFAKRIYDAGTGDKTDFAKIAGELGVSVESLKQVYDSYKKEQDKVLAEKKKTDEATLLKEGYSYIGTPAERDSLKAKGYIIQEINGRTYAKTPKTTTKTVKIGSTTYSITQDEMGKVINKSVVGSGGGTGTGSGNGKFILSDATAAMSQSLDEARKGGAEGFISREDWDTLMSQWMQAGGTAKAFADNFKQYANPTDTYKYLGL